MKKIFNKVVSAVLAAVMFVTAPAIFVCAEGEDTPGKYVSDVYIAYAKTEEEAVQWLVNNGWEPISGDNDFNAGKASFWDNSAGHRDNVAVAMGIKRTNEPLNAITDMAVMNMSGGYSFPDYESIVNEKKAEIDEFINNFLPTLQEYRANYYGEGSAVGKRRAELAHSILNKFYDGGADDPYAVNDTGQLLGDLFLSPLRQEGNPEGGDLQQIILESSGAAMLAVESALALAADSGEDTWLERLQEMGGDSFDDHISQYLPDNESQNLAPSAAVNLLKQRYGDSADILSKQWYDINEQMKWYESFNTQNDLWQNEGESDDDYAERVNSFFEAMNAADPEECEEVLKKYNTNASLYYAMYAAPYEGEWGETLGDFFNPSYGENYTGDVDAFLAFAAVLSPGQRCSAEFIPLSTLLSMGFSGEEWVDELFAGIDEVFAGQESISIYSGMNREIFRGGVALTSEALMQKNQGYDPYKNLFSFSGIYNITCYCAAIVGMLSLAAGLVLIKMAEPFAKVTARINVLERNIIVLNDLVAHSFKYMGEVPGLNTADMNTDITRIVNYEEELEGKRMQYRMGLSGRILTGVGGALLLLTACFKAYQMNKYYHKKFTAIPTMIVDEADIVTYMKDQEGNDIKLIDFDQFVYYEAVRCNRQQAGGIGDPQDGVDSYVEWGCGDLADLNADMGQEWLSLYTVKSPKKGNPILADSLKLQFGSDSMPANCNTGLHFFTYTYAADLGDTAYAYNNKKDGVYFFWADDASAYDEISPVASIFTAGHLAVAAVGGLLLGVLGATLILLPRRRKESGE